MKRKILTILLVLISVCTLSFVFTGCSENNNNDNVSTFNGITFNTFNVSGTNVDGGKVSNAITSFDFNNEIKANGDSSYEISLDEYGIQISTTKIVPLNAGDNTFYVFEKIDGEITKAYKVTIRRKPMYNVSFITGCDIVVDDQIIEEDNLALEPQAPSKLGYIFTGWDYDFSAPIAENTTINATWSANANTPYKVEYYLENLEDDNYTLMSSATENLVGTTDTIVNAEIKTFEHFTPTEEIVSGNINGDGLSTLKVYYKRNVYTIKANITNNGVVAGAGTYKYGEQVIITATAYLGYTFNGWYNGEELICSEDEIKFIAKEDFNVPGVAKFETKLEMTDFYFTSSETYCTIIGVKDKNISTAIIPNCVTQIDSSAFFNCINLVEITIPSSVVYFGEEAFDGCTSLNKVNYLGDIDEWANIYFNTNSDDYYGAYDYTSNPLYYAKNLYINNELVINAQLSTATKISKIAFINCVNLIDIVIPTSVKTIEDDAFFGCINLSKVNYLGTIDEWVEISFDVDLYYNYRPVISYSNPLSYAKNLYVCNDLVTIANITSATKISNGAFINCDSLQDVIIADSVENIGVQAFFNCSNLTSVKIGNSVKKISSNAFSECVNLSNIDLGNSVETIDSEAFYGCYSLVSITIPNSVQYIISYRGYYGVFYGCEGLTIYCEAIKEPAGWGNSWDMPEIHFSCPVVWDCNNNDIANDGYIYTIINGLQYGIKDGVATVARQARGITTANILRNITYKGVNYSVTSIGERAFDGCGMLSDITIPNCISSIGDYAFGRCDGLYIYCEAQSKPVGWSSRWLSTYDSGSDSSVVFIWDCNNNEVADDGYIYTVIDGIRYGIKDGAATVVRQSRNITTANIPSSITYKGTNYSVTSIGYEAFYNCDSLTSIEIPNSVTGIGERAFYDCSKLTSIVIPDSVTSIGNYAFSNCSSLNYNIKDGLKYLGNNNNKYLYLADVESNSITSATIDNNCRFIGSSTFYNCTSLTSVVIPDSVTSIGKYAFSSCNSLTIYCEAISKPSGWDSSWNYSNCPVYWYSETEPTTSGNYWYYVDGVVTKW